MPDGTCSVVCIDSTDVWTAIRKEFSSLLGYHTIITRAKDAVYEFFYDDSGEWACSESNRNVLAEDITGLVWYGPCILTKLDTTDANLENDSDFEDVIYNESKTYVDVPCGGDITEFLHELQLLF